MTEHAIVEGPAPGDTAPRGKHPPVWLFAILQIPYGVGGVFSSTIIGRILNTNQVDHNKSDWAVTASLLIAGFQFLLAPTVDLKLRRRSWYLLMSTVAACLIMAAMLTPMPQHVDRFIFFALTGQVAIGFLSACLGGLMVSTIPNELRGRASGFSNFGNVGVAAIAGGVFLQLLETRTLPLVGMVVAAAVILPALVVLTIEESPPELKSARELFGRMFGDIWTLLKRREGWTGLLLCMSPVGTAALLQLFSSYASLYHASDRTVTWVNGYIGGFLTGAACLLGGWICDRMNRRWAYIGAGALTAICGGVMAFAPITPQTYAIGALTYLFITGFCYAAFTAFELEVIGTQSATAGTQYSLYTSAGNFAIFYVLRLDSMGREWYEHRHGEALAPRGLLGTDAIVNVVGIVLFLALITLLKPKRKLA